MCGIWALFGLETHTSIHSNAAFTKIHHRGPDAWRIEYDDRLKNCCIGFHRLSIVDSLHGMQPMKIHQYPHLVLLCNGELYNCKRLQEQYGFTCETKCDVEVILHLFMSTGGDIKHVVSSLDGVFAFCLVDLNEQKVYLGRDPYGVRPLFRLRVDDEVLGICSEAKGLVDVKSELNGKVSILEQFPPSHYEVYQIGMKGYCKLLKKERYYTIGQKPNFKTFIDYEKIQNDSVHDNIRTLLTASVQKRLMAERRIGCLLSGGLDSSLIAALLVKEAQAANLPYKIQTFSVGMDDSPDIIAARKVAAHINSEHHEVLFTKEDIANALEKVIYHLETCDITTIRASVGMYLVSKYIKENTDTTVLLSGEGADELAQGYIYFRDAPSAGDAHNESLRLLNDIYLYDGLRADRTTSAFSLELRVPFLDLQFTSYYLSLPAALRQPKNGIEKHLLRSAFDGTDLLPHSILWRHKEAFSDGVTSKKKSLFQIIQDLIELRLMNDAFKESGDKYKHCAPKTKESLYYREVFEKDFPNQAEYFMPYFWMPKWIQVSDPSARFISHYAADKE